MSTWDRLCWRMGKLGGVGVDHKFEMRRRSEVKKKDHGYAEGNRTEVKHECGTYVRSWSWPCDDSADEGGVVDAASEPGSGIQARAGRIPCQLNVAGWVTVDLRRLMVSVIKVYR